MRLFSQAQHSICEVSTTRATMITPAMLLWMSSLLMITTAITRADSSAVSSHYHRRLLGYDAWATAPICQLTPTAQSNTDSLGRLWGWEKQASCTFKDQQQQPLYPGSVPALQQWGAVAACPEAPISQNSAADTAGRLWGVWYGRSCAFKTSSGEPAYYEGYQGPKYSSPKPSPAPELSLPQASPAVVPKSAVPAAVPSPSPTQASARASPLPRKSPRPTPRSPSPSPSPFLPPSQSNGMEPTSAQPGKLPQPVLSKPLAASRKPSPSPLPSPPLQSSIEPSKSTEPTSAQPSTLPQPVLSMPPAVSPKPSTSPSNGTWPSPVPAADSGTIVCKCPETVKADLDTNKIATLVADQLWQKLADASNGYEGDSIKLAENDVLSLNTSAGAKQQQKQVLKLTNLLSAIEALAQQAVKRSAADPAGLIKASEWNSPEANTAPSAPVYVSPVKPSPALSIMNHLVSILHTSASEAMRRPGQATGTAPGKQQ